MGAAVVAGFTIPDQPRFTLEEVHEITGFSKRSLEDGCREQRIGHCHWGRQRVLSREQLVAFIASTEGSRLSRSSARTLPGPIRERLPGSRPIRSVWRSVSPAGAWRHEV